VKSETGTETKFDFGDAIDTIGGAVLKTKNGEIEVNNTIEARLLRYKKDLRGQVAKILFN
jgi:V/A-type H+-transporting ATPase subunit E